MSTIDFAIATDVKVVQAYIANRRPPLEVRSEVDVACRVDGTSVYVYELRKSYGSPEEMIEVEVAKMTYIKSRKVWKLYWMRSDCKWHAYPPAPEHQSIESVIGALDEDSNCCFWG